MQNDVNLMHDSRDDKHISTVDGDGVALAAIQGLHQLVKEKDTEIQELKKAVTKLERVVAALASREREGR